MSDAAALGADVEAAARTMTVIVSYGMYFDPRPGRVIVDGESLRLPKRHGFAPRRRIIDLRRWGAQADARSAIRAAIAAHSTSGFVRQTAVRPLVQCGALWTMPYIAQLASDYVLEIVAELDENFHAIDRDNLQRYVADNPAHIELTAARVHSF